MGCEPADPLEAIRQQQATGQFQATIEPLRELMDERRGDSEVQYLYGLALARTGQPSLADWALSEAMRDPKWLLPAGHQLLYDSLATGNNDRAIEIASTILESHPENLDILQLRANAYAHSRMHYEEALADADRIFELDPENALAMEPRILSLLGLERIEEAREAIEELGRRIEKQAAGSASEGWHCATSAIFALEDGQETLAEERWADCLERFPGHSNVVTNALQFFDSRREYDRSLEVLRAAHEAEPESRSYRTGLAGRLRFSGRAQESEELLKRATESDEPHLATLAWFDLAKHYQELGQHQLASESQERALVLAREADLPHSQLLLEYADALLLAGRLDEALQIADEMTLEAHQAMIRARVAQQQGRHADALEHFDAAFRLWPNNPYARYYAAVASEQIGDFDSAIESYRYSIRIAPDATDARTRLGQLQLAQGRPSDAMMLLRLKSDQAPLDLAGELLSIQLWGQIGNMPALVSAIERFRQGSPGSLGFALESAAKGVRERAGAEAAAALLLRAQVDFEDPMFTPALRALVRLQFETPDAAAKLETRAGIDAALARHPQVAEFREILGLWLELSGDEAGARDAYRDAIAIDGQNPGALAGLGRLTLDPQQAIDLLERAAAARPDDAEVGWETAQRLLSASRVPEAERRLETLLRQHPYDARASLALAQIRLERGDTSDRSLELAQRAVRFGRSADALELVSRIHRMRGESELADQAEARAGNLRQSPPGVP